MKAAIMQPYFFPYIGYFQLIKVVDVFVFYDDVNYIKGGWINRNRILLNGEAKYINIPQQGASPNKLINEVGVNPHPANYKKVVKTLELAYKQAVFYDEVIEIIECLFSKEYNNLAVIAAESVRIISEYLGLETKFLVSSQEYGDTINLDRSERIYHICKDLEADTYINAIGGQEIYTKEDFERENIQLKFIKSKAIEYKQFDNEFIPWLSIIDVLMFNSVEEINVMLNQYELV